MKKKKSNDDNLITENRKARHNYEITDTIECGIVLLGSEVKSIRQRHINLQDSYAIIKNNEVFILGLRIDKFIQATHEVTDPLRTRKLLLRKKEIKKLLKVMQNKSISLIPLKAYFKDSKVKILLGLGTGKTKIDKRQTLKERTIKKELSRVLRRG